MVDGLLCFLGLAAETFAFQHQSRTGPGRRQIATEKAELSEQSIIFKYALSVVILIQNV